MRPTNAACHIGIDPFAVTNTALRTARPYARIAGAIALLLMITLAFIRVRNAGFIWDDEAHLTQNPCIIGPLGFSDIWTSARAVYYPLVLSTFWLLHKFAGLDPLPYHLLNVAWHAASALMLWRVLRQLRVRGSWLGAAIWAVHPVMVQSVAWVTEMKNTQSAFFYLLTIFLFLSSRASKSRPSLYILSVVSFAAAITSKPSTVMLPVVLALSLWWKQGRLRRPDFVSFLPFATISFLASAWTVWEQKYHAGAMGLEWVQTPLQRVLISADAIWFYALKLVWPHPLIFIYPRWHVDTSTRINYLPLAGVILVTVTLFALRNRKLLLPLVFALSYFVITLFPVLDFFDVYFFRYSFVSDHFQYLASMGPLALAAAILTGISQNRSVRITVAIGVLATLGFLTWQQTGNYHDVITLYQATLAQNPHCWMADYNLGLALNERGDIDGAIVHYRRALASNEKYIEAHYNLGGALVRKGEIAEALAHYHRAIELKPDDGDSHNNYASTLRQIGETGEAEAEYRRSITLQPDFLDARLNLASLLLQTGRTEEALAQLHDAARIQPGLATTHTALGNALMKVGRLAEAERQYSQAILLSPDEASALNSFAWLLATAPDDSLRDGDKALALAQRANTLRKGADPVILHTLAAAYAEAGQFKQAIAIAEEATRLAGKLGNQTLVTALHDEIALYQLGLPYRQSR